MLFLQERDKYISLLQEVITCTRESSVLCFLYLLTQVLLLTEPEITSKQLSQQKALFKKQALLITKQQISYKKRMFEERRISVKAETLINLDQEQRVLFLYKQEEYSL